MSRSVAEGLSRPFQSGSEVVGNAGYDQRTGCVEGNDLAPRAQFAAAQDILEQLRVLSCIAAAQFVKARPHEAQSLRLDNETPNATGLESMDLRGTRGGDLIKTSGPVNCPGAFAAKEVECLRINRQQLRVKHPSKLKIGPGWVKERTEKIENRGSSFLRESLSDRRYRLECRMIQRCKKKTASRDVQSGLGRQVEPHAKGLEHISAAAFRSDSTVTMFDHARAARRGDKHHRRGNVDQPCPIATRSANIQQPVA